MNYEKINMGAYNLHIIKTKKFKTITVDIAFRRKIQENEITIRNVLKDVLLNSNYNFPNEIDLIKETENLYDLKLLASSTRIGNYTNLSFKIRFLNDIFTEDTMNEESIKFLLDIILKPNIKNNKFQDNILESSKERIKKSIMSVKDNKLKYSLLQLLSKVSSKPYSYNALGTLKDLNDITSENLYNYYKSMIENDFVDIFVVGDVDTNKIKNILKENFRLKTYHKPLKDILVEELEETREYNTYKENDNVNQSQLTILCSLNNLTDFERKYVLKIYNEILGGSSNSLLFTTVREENSYAYYINSLEKAYDNVLLIYAGIEPGNNENVIKLINENLENIEKGHFEDKLINSAKETIIGSIEAGLDSPIAIINSYLAKELVNTSDINERIEQFKNVTKEDVINISKKIKIHTIFTLEGEKNEND